MRDRVVISGGAGFIGSHLAEALAENYNVVVLDNFSTGTERNLVNVRADRIRIVRGDIRDFEVARTVLRKAKAVFHEAAMVSVTRSILHPLLTNDVNVTGTLNLLLASVANKVPWFINASSSSIYGEQKRGLIHEEMQSRPISVYAVSKLAAERYCLAFHRTHKLNTVCLRYFNVYGPRQCVGRYSGVITTFIGNALKGKPLEIFGDGSQTRDFTYVTDIVQANMSALGNEEATGEVLNIGTGASTSINDVAKSVQRLQHNPVPRILHKPPRPGEVLHSKAVITKANRILHYRPRVELSDGLRNVYRWFKSGNSQRRQIF
jgi:UDP-glucose 4-epimerase